MKPIERAILIGSSLFAAASCWSMAATLYTAWHDPLAIDGGRWVSLGVGIMVMEFILVHSGAVLPALAAKATGESSAGRKLVFISLMYIVFGVSISLAFKSWLLFGIFTGIMVPRWLSVTVDAENAFGRQKRRSALSALLYLLVVFLSVFVPFPDGGLTPGIIAQAFPESGGGLWETHPQQALAAGTIYFGVLGAAELASAFRKKPGMQTSGVGQ